ncbi:organic solvent tolerance protein, partial [Candidatus Pelagibacter bacterium]|nr:organic solvent tolerance protein [Candidatus Pelagibacter bacterium]
YDDLNEIILRSEKFTYLKKQELIFTKTKTIIEYDKEYFLDAQELTFNRNQKKIFSEKKINIKDLNGNISLMSKFNLSLTTKLLIGDDLEYLDSTSNKIYMKNAAIDLSTKEIIGKDPIILFENESFGNKKNEPRLKGVSINVTKENTKVKKATFTTCQKKDGCPPWTLSASEVNHDKVKKVINYKNSWLRLYDKPVFYFPKFFHPDPTVKRQSGFLIPKFKDSNLLGSSLNVPYFNVISESKDMTFSPTFFTNKSAIFQTEYRQVSKQNKHDVDFSYFADGKNSKKYSSKSHFFSRSKSNLNFDSFEESDITMEIQQSSNDTYLKTYKLKSPLIKDESLLHSFVEFNGAKENSNLNITTEVFEDLTKSQSDRYEYILPSFNFIKNIYPEDTKLGYFSFEAKGFQKQNNTNINETSLINNLYLNSNSIITNKGFKNKYVGLIKNVNKKIEDSNNSNKDEGKILSALLYEITYPVKKKMTKYDNIFTPILSLRYSPNQTRNLKDEDRRINISNIYSIDRLGKDDSIEGGQSATLGASFKKKDKSGNDYLAFEMATSIRDRKNEDMPLTTTMMDKTSDIVGNFSYEPNEVFELSYDFSYDNNLKYSNFDSFTTQFKVNNFVTEFEFLEENNLIGSESYLSNKTGLNLSENKRISFSTRRNRKTDLTEYYNLMYEYKNDCLVASIQYKKDYYTDVDLKPEEQLFFSLTIVPFTTTNSPNINK